MCLRNPVDLYIDTDKVSSAGRYCRKLFFSFFVSISSCVLGWLQRLALVLYALVPRTLNWRVLYRLVSSKEKARRHCRIEYYTSHFNSTLYITLFLNYALAFK
jgi:hypothetical protein